MSDMNAYKENAYKNMIVTYKGALEELRIINIALVERQTILTNALLQVEGMTGDPFITHVVTAAIEESIKPIDGMGNDK